MIKDPTFKVEENVRLVVLEHLCDQFNIHVLNVDLLYPLVNNSQDKINLKGLAYLEAFVHDHNSFIEFLLFKKLDRC